MSQVGSVISFMSSLFVSSALISGLCVTLLFTFINPTVDKEFDEVNKNLTQSFQNVSSQTKSTKAFVQDTDLTQAEVASYFTPSPPPLWR